MMKPMCQLALTSHKHHPQYMLHGSSVLLLAIPPPPTLEARDCPLNVDCCILDFFSGVEHIKMAFLSLPTYSCRSTTFGTATILKKKTPQQSLRGTSSQSLQSSALCTKLSHKIKLCETLQNLAHLRGLSGCSWPAP